MEFTLHVNGESYGVNVDPKKPLLWVLRDELGLMGTKFGCGIGLCRTCAVLVDGDVKASCIMQMDSVGESQITTIEGLDSTIGTAVKEAWIVEEVSQCGYCQPGQLINATDLLSKIPSPTDADINSAMTTLCRCGTYPRIRTAIKTAAKNIK
jgi:isoquinoline 1-oxidoreductase alpha subunit